MSKQTESNAKVGRYIIELEGKVRALEAENADCAKMREAANRLAQKIIKERDELKEQIDRLHHQADSGGEYQLHILDENSDLKAQLEQAEATNAAMLGVLGCTDYVIDMLATEVERFRETSTCMMCNMMEREVCLDSKDALAKERDELKAQLEQAEARIEELKPSYQRGWEQGQPYGTLKTITEIRAFLEGLVAAQEQSTGEDHD